MSITSEPHPFIEITIGCPIYTRDYQEIGVVKELRGNAFKVSTPLFQRDYWLSTDSVRTAAPDGAVLLGIDKAELGAHKIAEPRAAA